MTFQVYSNIRGPKVYKLFIAHDQDPIKSEALDGESHTCFCKNQVSVSQYSKYLNKIEPFVKFAVETVKNHFQPNADLANSCKD